MTENRRYSDAEVKKIFEEAAALAEKRQLSAAEEGFTLAELQDIGREVGLPPERIAAAAGSLDVATPLPRRRHFGLPIAVGHVVTLPAIPDDRQWNLFLGEIRRTFNASGRDRSTSVTRHWSNGNLHVLVEPVEGGARLRMGTLKSGAAAANWLGFSWTLAGVATAAAPAALVGADLLVAPSLSFGFIAMGVGAFLSNVVRLPRWAGAREEQMASLAARARSILARPSGE